MGRLLVQELQDAAGTVLGKANYEYSAQNLIAKITYDYYDDGGGIVTFGFTSEFSYDVAARLLWAKHTEKDAANPYLRLDYTYNKRDLITQIIETDAYLVQSTVTI